MKPGLAFIASAAALGTFVAHPAVAQDGPSPAAASTQEGMHHAAVVIDTGDGVVRKMCLSFPEAELSGIEALRRVDTRPNRFETFSGKGSGVCMLCGVGCASGDCFCDPAKYWAYHRSGPGESQYRPSSLGASSTVVRDGDVEAWRWGNGGAPPKTSVSEVCDVPEPPARTTGSSTSTSSPPGETTTTGVPATTTTDGSPVVTPPLSSPAARPPGGTGTPTTQAAGTPATTGPGEVVATAPESDPQAPGAADAAPSAPDADDRAAADGLSGGDRSNLGQLVGLAVFGALLGGLLVWRSRLRGAKRREMRPVR